jgi:hypothetical protein
MGELPRPAVWTAASLEGKSTGWGALEAAETKSEPQAVST